MTHPSRRTVLATGLAATATATAIPRASGADSVNMELLVLAAQLDPVKTGTGITAGAKASVLLVERALAAKALLAERHVDGHFGTATKDAYAAWQRSLGHSGLAANGLPGKSSLTALGKGQFTLTRPVSVGDRTKLQGFPFNSRTVMMLKAAFTLADVSPAVEQGSYSAGVDPTSAGTHDGGGAVDLDAEELSGEEATRLVRAMRQVGFAAWLRTPDQADWPLHIHGIAINDLDLHVTAQNQVGDYYLGRNGLANKAPDDGPQVTKGTWEEHLRSTS
ncbi:hypothetical protein [Demetria terragena]|uniref:hypothetical protein n=1 Tax=Demetria terragena TaxID=63959 RepID=UPI00058EC441|nr:hypothetical protein [Demetria terragena]